MLHDLRVAVRVLVQHRAFAVVTVLTLALGIGANTAIFSAVDAVLLRRPPVESIDRVGMLWETDRNSGTTREPASVPDYLDFRERSRAFAGLAALMAGEVNLSSRTEDPVRLVALRVTHDLLPLLGVFPVAGRAFTEAEDRLGGPRVALISDSLWQRAFGRSRSALGETLRLDEVPYTIVGVVPDTADFGVLQILSRAAYARGFVDRVAAARVDVWTALRADAGALPRDTHPIFVLGRLAPGASFETAQHDTAAIAADLERTHRSNDGRGTFVEPLTEVVFGPVRPALVILLGAVALVLLVACVNVANLLLARGVARAREVAVRASLGAGLGRLTRQFLVENLVLTGAATAAGIGLAYLALRALVAFAPGDIPRLSSATIDLRVLGATVAVSVLVALVFGLVPTVQAHRLDVQAAVQGGDGSRATAGRERSRLRSALVVTELSLAVVLVVGAVLLVKSFSRLLDVSPGFRPAGVLKAEYQLPRTRYPANFAAWPDFKEMHAFTRELVRRASALPGVERVAVVGNHPLDPGFTTSFTIVGREAEAAGWPEMSIRRVTPGYFETVGLPLLRGRLLQDTDGTTDAAVLLVNAAAARRFFGGRDPIGAQVRFWGAARTVVGVVADERFHGLEEAPPIGVYVPLAQAPSADGAGVLLVRTARDPDTLASAVRGAVRDVDPALAVFGVEPLEQTLSRSVSQRRFAMLLLAAFAGLALALAVIGIEGVLGYEVARRTREFGIRMALGGGPSDVLRLVFREALTLAAAGLAIGLAGAAALSRVLAGLLYGVTPTDPATYAGVAGALGAVAIAASSIPALRATRVDPAAALRAE